MIIIKVNAPTRIDLAGGTLDLWPLHHVLDYKATINAAISLEATVILSESKGKTYTLKSLDQGETFQGSYKECCDNKTLPLLGIMLKALWKEDLPSFVLETTAKSPSGAGLGGSSCLAVSVAGALWRARQLFEGLHDFREKSLVHTIQNAEARLINAPTGCQDYWAAVRGGINIISYPFEGPLVETLSTTNLQELKDELILCYSGKSRASALNNWEIFRRVFDGDEKLIHLLNGMGRAAEECALAIKKGDFSGAMASSEKEWSLRCHLWPHITTSETERLDMAAKKAGARFSRVCGAGGGGVMAIFSPLEAREKVKAALTKAGGQVLEGNVVDEGLTVKVVSQI